MSVAIESKSVQRNLEDGGNLEDEISFQLVVVVVVTKQSL